VSESLPEWCPKLHRNHCPKPPEFPASVKDMNDWGIDLYKCRLISEKDFMKLRHQDSIMKQGDVLIAKDGSYLKHCFVVEKDLDVALLSSIAILRPNEKINSFFLTLTLKRPAIKARMSGYVSGAALPRIILKDFSKFLLTNPSATIQKYFAEAIEPYFHLIWTLIKSIDNLRCARDFLLPKLISGKIDVSDLDIDIGE